MVQMPKKPLSWGNDMKDLQVSPNPGQDAPITVTNPAALAQPAPESGCRARSGLLCKIGRNDPAAHIESE